MGNKSTQQPGGSRPGGGRVVPGVVSAIIAAFFLSWLSSMLARPDIEVYLPSEARRTNNANLVLNVPGYNKGSKDARKCHYEASLTTNKITVAAVKAGGTFHAFEKQYAATDAGAKVPSIVFPANKLPLHGKARVETRTVCDDGYYSEIFPAEISW